MDLNDFHYIKHFTAKEVKATGADITDVKFELMMALEKLRIILGRPMILLKNGLTTGSHKSPTHPQGQACDFYFTNSHGAVFVNAVFKSIIKAGFKGVGIYWNGNLYSFHVDRREEYSFWSATKPEPGNPWKYGPLIVDPRLETT